MLFVWPRFPHPYKKRDLRRCVSHVPPVWFVARAFSAAARGRFPPLLSPRESGKQSPSHSPPANPATHTFHVFTGKHLINLSTFVHQGKPTWWIKITTVISATSHLDAAVRLHLPGSRVSAHSSLVWFCIALRPWREDFAAGYSCLTPPLISPAPVYSPPAGHNTSNQLSH